MTRYEQYLYDPGAVVEWRDVIEVFYTQPAVSEAPLREEDETKCPICLEPAPFMLAPRATKCGHLLCYSCVLQYLDFEREKPWKKCPLCNEPIYKKDLRRATILTKVRDSVKETKEEVIEFTILARNKSNTIVKDLCHSKEPTILKTQLPSVTETQYRKSRVLLADEGYIREAVN